MDRLFDVGMSVYLITSVTIILGLVAWPYCHQTDAENEKVWAQCHASQAACDAVQERLGLALTISPWQPMTLTPILDPR